MNDGSGNAESISCQPRFHANLEAAIGIKVHRDFMGPAPRAVQFKDLKIFNYLGILG